MKIPENPIGRIPPDPVASDSLKGVSRQQTNPQRWQGEGWSEFRDALRGEDVAIHENRASCAVYVTDAGGIAHGMPTGTFTPRNAGQIAAILRRAQEFEVPVTCRGGGLTTEGESVGFGGLLLDMSGMSRVLEIDPERMTVRTEAGIYWLQLAEHLRREGLDYLSAPLNMTSSVGGTLGVGGIDINSPRFGCSADQALALQVVTPTGDLVECSEMENPDLFERVLFGYGQFGIITEATLKIRPFTPITMRYFYYGSLERGIRDMQMLVREDAADYCGILTIMDRAITLLVAFDSDEREEQFNAKWRSRLTGHGEPGFALRVGAYYLMRPWKWREAAYLLDRRMKLFPAFRRPEFIQDGKIMDRAVVFSQMVWNFWGQQEMIIPDLATNEEKFVEAVLRGNRVCRKYFDRYTLYCVGIRTWPDRPRYEMSCIPPDAVGFGYGCEFQPMLKGQTYSRDYLQAYKNEIYDIGVDMKTSYYRFGGMMKGYIRRVFGDALVDRHLAMKRRADPAMILNRDVVF